MEKIFELFKQLHTALDETRDIKIYQEFNILLKHLYNHSANLYELMGREMKDSTAFLQDIDPSVTSSYGKCGDTVYWKIVDGVLFIGGRGDMWDFVNIVSDCENNKTHSPWRYAEFHTVIIGGGVSSIGAEAFSGAEISGVMIPGSVKRIAELAFFDARIEKLVIPNTVETIEEGILNGFRRVADTLVLAANIPNIQPYAFFNRDDAIANTVCLTGDLPEDLIKLIDSALFDSHGDCKIYYPIYWDTSDISFLEVLKKAFRDKGEPPLEDIEKRLLPYRI